MTCHVFVPKGKVGNANQDGEAGQSEPQSSAHVEKPLSVCRRYVYPLRVRVPHFELLRVYYFDWRLLVAEMIPSLEEKLMDVELTLRAACRE